MSTIKELIDTGRWDPARLLKSKIIVKGELLTSCTTSIETNHKGSFVLDSMKLDAFYETAELEIEDFATQPFILETIKISNVKLHEGVPYHHWHFNVEWPQSITIAASAAVP